MSNYHVVEDISVHECQIRCGANMSCSCAEFERDSKTCYMQKRAMCEIETKCERSQTTDVYLQKSAWGKAVSIY